MKENAMTMIEVTDIDVVAYAMMSGKVVEPAEEGVNGKISFRVAMTQEEKADYYNSPFRRFKEKIDLVKKTFLDRRNGYKK